MGILCRELYKISGLIQESTRKGGRNKYKLKLFTTKNTSLLENSKNQFKNLDRVSLNKRVQEKAGFTNATLPTGKHEKSGKLLTAKQQKKENNNTSNQVKNEQQQQQQQQIINLQLVFA